MSCWCLPAQAPPAPLLQPALLVMSGAPYSPPLPPPPRPLLGRKNLGASVDVYAFGILMWQLLCGTSLYRGMNAVEIVRAVVRKGLRPTFPTWVPEDYR